MSCLRLLLCPLFVNSPVPTLCPSLFGTVRRIAILGELSSVWPLSALFFLLVQVMVPGEFAALTESVECTKHRLSGWGLGPLCGGGGGEQPSQRLQESDICFLLPML